MTHKESRERNERMKAFKAEGHSFKEVADCFGVSLSLATSVTKGIAPQKQRRPKVYHNQNKKETEEEKRNYVESFLPFGFSYDSGYIDCDHHVMLRCNVCSSAFDASMITIRQGGRIICPNCAEIDRTEKQRIKQKQKDERQKEREETKRLKALSEAVRLVERFHPCQVCGTSTMNRKYCSKVCSDKANNHRKESKRRAKLVNALVDADIEIHELYRRDNGVCHICGGVCDWNDKEYRPQGIVCGNNYPSIDHVVPLSKGGLHAWDNVQLAHRLCNSLKRDYISPWG